MDDVESTHSAAEKQPAPEAAPAQQNEDAAYGPAFEIFVCFVYPLQGMRLCVCGDNQLGQILAAVAADLGILDPSDRIIFCNSRTGKYTEDRSLSVKEFELQAGDHLTIAARALA